MIGISITELQVKAIAKELGITPAQVIISWHVQRGVIVLPKSVTPSRIEENCHSEFRIIFVLCNGQVLILHCQVSAIPQDLFDKLEAAAASHPPQRVVNPSKNWGLDFDIFE